MSRPFHDRRVVELGLAIPEDLHVRCGRDRYLALQALGDIYPPEFRDRDWRNDSVLPDLDGMMKAILPQLHDEIDRMAEDPAIARYIDFPYLKRAFAPLGAGQSWSKVLMDRKVVPALLGFSMAKYVVWAQGRNNSLGGNDNV
jgi:asparagine synthase (glutamine-hydrolysing)